MLRFLLASSMVARLNAIASAGEIRFEVEAAEEMLDAPQDGRVVVTCSF